LTTPPRLWVPEAQTQTRATRLLFAICLGRNTDRRKALAALVAAGDDGLTDFELAARLSRQQTSSGKRRGELRDLGLVADTGRRRPAPSGSAAIVWAITPLGLRADKALKQEF
jgi:hypothetical protein